MNNRTTTDLIRIASAGGGFILDTANRITNDLVRIAAAAAGSSARVTFRGIINRTNEDLIRIAAAGKGAVVFAD